MSDKTNGAELARATDESNGAAGTDGRMYWRSLEQLADSPEYEKFLHREFQPGADEVPADAVSRRGFLGVVAAAVALAGATACRKPERRILPYSERPEDLVPGIPRHYATALQLDGYGVGALVRSSDGRPTKVEGNPLHPASRGGSNGYLQAELLNLYDPARSKSPLHEGAPVTRSEFEAFWRSAKNSLGEGDKLAFLLGPTTSPTMAELVAAVGGVFANSSFHTYRPVNRDNELEGARLAFGRALDANPDLTAADVIVSLDCDFLSRDGDSIRLAREFADRRRPAEGSTDPLNRLYVAEPGQSVTGGQADHRFRVRAHQVADVAMALAAELAKLGVLTGALVDAAKAHAGHGLTTAKGVNWVEVAAKDLAGKRGKSLILAGPRQPAAVHAVVHALNTALGNVGSTVTYTATPELAGVNQLASIEALADAMDHDRVDTLFILGGNPVHDAPADLQFAAKLAKVKNRIHVGLHVDETARACNWHLNAAHQLEAWGDIRARGGMAAIQQPLVAPLYGGISEIELLGMIAEYEEHEGYAIVRYHWDENTRTEDFDAWWNRALHDGVIWDSAFAPEIPSLQANAVVAAMAAHRPAPAAARDNLEVTFAQDATIYDGRYANNAWMQECPDPVTKLAWDNAAVMSVKTAEELGVKNGDVLELALAGRQLRIPAWIVPGTADHSIALTIGQGRELGADFTVATGAGFDTCGLRGMTSFGMAMGLKATRTGETYTLHSTQDHGSMEGRDLYRAADVEEYRAKPTFAPDMSPLAKSAQLEGQDEKYKLKSLWPERDYSTGYQWGMVIDLNSCNGCNACVVACQSENNIPSVGKDEVGTGREMHWLRVDRYYAGPEHENPEDVNEDDVGMVYQPVPCMQCENAPCESVCPVAATVHSPEGLNDMAYNRCIGTRYCSNNCPYKVRKFNWFDFVGKLDPSLQMAQNPDVTIRARGVMEKCTYCVQRINGAKIQAKLESRQVVDGEVVPACGQACPSQAITFGNINDPESRVARLRASSLNYALLSELNVKPRTTYLAKIRNPNPELS